MPIGNEAYNRLYAKMSSVNTLLAWGHARVIENLMGQRHRMNPPPVRAISDQFASNKDTVAKALMTLGREIELVQRHEAEEDLAVAAASILARHEFVTRLAELEKEFGMKFPKAPRPRWTPRRRNLFPNTAAENFPRSPRCTSARPSARKDCLSRRRRSGAGRIRRARVRREMKSADDADFRGSREPVRYFSELRACPGIIHC